LFEKVLKFDGFYTLFLMFYELVVKTPQSLENAKLFIGVYIYNKIENNPFL
jgi:hypothetical protein